MLDRFIANQNGDARRSSQVAKYPEGAAAQDLADRELTPVNLSAMSNNAPPQGAPSSVMPAKGKRAFAKDHMNVYTGQARLFGSESEQAAKAEPAKRGGKKILPHPYQGNKLM